MFPWPDWWLQPGLQRSDLWLPISFPKPEGTFPRQSSLSAASIACCGLWAFWGHSEEGPGLAQGFVFLEPSQSQGASPHLSSCHLDF